jgi:alpha-galactosidase
MYYAFYAPAFSGQVELRGLTAGKKYSVSDYFNNKDLGTMKGENGKIKLAFNGFCLLEVVPQP